MILFTTLRATMRSESESESQSAEGIDLRLPTDQFYWALLDTAVLGGRSPASSTRQLGYLFEAALPVPIESVHAVYLRVDKAHCFACGMNRERLDARLGQHSETSAETELLGLGPESIPAFIKTIHDCDAHRVNLLVGKYEPRMVRTARRRWAVQLATFAIITMALVVFGLERRVRAMESRVSAAQQAQADVYGQVLGPRSLSASGQPPALQITAELRRLRQTRRQPSGVTRAADCSATFATLLAAWPTDPAIFMQTESVVIAPEAITVRGAVPTSGDAQSLVSHVGGEGASTWKSWLMQQPQINVSGQAVQVSLQWRKSQEGKQ